MTRITYIPNRVIDTDGIADGASIYVYQTGTTTPVSLYLDAGLTVPTTNPYVVANGAAVPSLYHGYAGQVRLRIVSVSGSVQDTDPYPILVNTDEVLDVVTDEGDTLAEVAARAHQLNFGNTKVTALTRAEARTMAADLTNMKGYALNAGTTGGAGKTEYWVTNASDDEGFTGSLRWAITQAIAGGGGLILFDPLGSYEITLKKLLIVGASSTNTCNITIDAPGRNVTIRNLPKVEGIRLSGENIIFRRIRITNLAGTYIDGEEKDGLGLNALYCDKVWIDECELGHVSDGIMDTASSALSSAATSSVSGFCRISATHNIIRNQDKCIVLGKTGISSGVLGSTYRVLATFHENWFHAASQRMPLTQQNAFAHLVNNVIDFSPFSRQDGTSSAVQGAYARYGGANDCYYNLWRSLDGASHPAISGEADGCYRTTGDVVEDGNTLSSANTGFMPVIPYTLTPSAIPAAGVLRDAWAEAIIAKCGPFETPFPRERYVFHSGTSSETPDGVRIIPWGTGYYSAIEPRDKQPTIDPNVGLALTRKNTKTIASDAITLESGDSYFAIDGEGAAADDLVTINGGADGVVIGMRCVSSARPITVKSTGNIQVPQNVILDHIGKTLWLIYDTGSAKWAVMARYPSIRDFLAEDYGAKGDGTTDDAPAIQAAIAAAVAAGGGRVRFQAKTYLCNSQLTWSTAPIQLVGEGCEIQPTLGTVLKFPSGLSGAVNPRNGVGGLGAGSVIRNLTIRGSATVAVSDANALLGVGCGLLIQANGVQVDHVAVQAFEGNGFMILSDGTISKNANLCHIEHLRCYDNLKNGVCNTGTDSNHNTFISLDCSGNGQQGVYENSPLGNSYYNPHFSGNGTGGTSVPILIGASGGYNRFYDVYKEVHATSTLLFRTTAAGSGQNIIHFNQASGSSGSPSTFTIDDVMGDTQWSVQSVTRFAKFGGDANNGTVILGESATNSGARFSLGAKIQLQDNPLTANWYQYNTSGKVIFENGGAPYFTVGTTGFGYGVGSGGTGGSVTQLTSKSTAVTLNKVCGRLVTNNAALAAGGVVTFRVNNSNVNSIDDIILNLQSGPATPGTYRYWVEQVAVGFFDVTIENRSAGSLSEVLNFNFAIVKGIAT